MKVYIVTEGYQSTGYGHITRCLSIYQAFAEKNIIPQIMVNGDKNAKQFLGNSKYHLIDWLDNPALLYDKVDNSDIVIIDSYKAGEEIYAELYGRTKLLAVIDDNVRLKYKAHVVINGTIGAEDFEYEKKEGVKYLLGAGYIPLRKEFWDIEEKQINPEIKDVLITFGGQDVKNLTQPVLDYFLGCAPYLNYWIVAREDFKIDFKKYTSLGTVKFVFDADAAKMKELMLKCDVAVTAAGQTIYELARTGLPAIAVIVADNQVKNLQGWMKNGFIFEELHYDDEKLLNKIGEGIFRLNEKEIRSSISNKGKSIIDGRGSITTLNDIFSIFTENYGFYFRDADIKDAKIIYELSSDPVVRANSINQNKISWAEHIEWFSKKIADRNYIFKLCFNCENQFIGQVRFYLEGGTAVASISIEKTFRGKGLSYKILQSASSDLFKQNKNINLIKAYIKPDNTPSINGFLKAGFEFSSVETINNEVYNLYYLKR